MIKRYFYILSTSLFILLSPTTGVKAEIVDKQLETLARQTNSPPTGINYQAAVRDNNGEILQEALVDLRFTLSSDASDLWIETHTATTDALGMVNLVIGSGTKFGGSLDTFDELDWSAAVTISVELNTGTGFVAVGDQALQSVPYANYAANGMTTAQSTKLDALSLDAEQNVQSDWNQSDVTADDHILNKPSIPTDINQLTDADGKLTAVSFDGSYNSLTDVPANIDTDATDDFSGSYNDLTGLPANIDTDKTDDFSGSYTDLTNVPANIDTDATDDFSGSYNDLTDLPANIDTDKTDDFSGSYTDLTNVPANIDTDATDDFSGSYNDLTDLPANLDTDATNDFSGSYNDLTDLPANLDTDKTDDFSGSYTDLTNVPANIDTDATDDFSGSYNDLTDLPTNIDTDKTDDFSGSYTDLTNVPANIDTDATDDFSGSYNDLTDLPANLDTDATDDFSGSYNDLTNKPTIASNIDGLADGDGNADLNGTFTANSLVVDGAFTLPTADGTNGQVLTTDGSGNVSWVSASSGGEFSNASNVVSAGDADDDFVFGSTQLADDNSGTNDDKRMFFDKSKGAFRTGSTSGTQWDDVSVGSVSAVIGGNGNTASGGGSFVGGGYYNTASGQSSANVGGTNNNASGGNSATIGSRSGSVSNYNSVIVGGRDNSITGRYSAIAAGRGVNAQAWGEFAFGSFSENAASADATNFVATDRLLTVGNGTADGSRSNAMTMLKNGNTDINGTFTANSLGVDGAFTLPTADGTNGQVLQTNGSGTVSWGTAGGSYAGTGTDSFVAGASSNATVDANGTVSGGENNKVGVQELSDAGLTSKSSTIGGGKNNSTVGDYTTVAGGYENSAFGKGATVGGGRNNDAGKGSINSTGTNAYSTIGGGKDNTTNGKFSTIPGGTGLYTSSYGATVMGVFNSTTGGTNSSFVATEALLVVGNGTSSSAKSDAMTMLKNGNTDINGTFKANSLGVDGAFTLPTADGTNGQVLTTNGSGTVAWSTASSGGEFSNASNVVSAGDSDDDFVFGSTQLADDNSGSTDNRRMFFDKSKGAFRAGYAPGNQWDDASIGNNSAAIGGNNTIASGIGSFVAGGYTNVASGPASFIGGGGGNTASSDRSVILGGYGNISSSNRSTVIGGESNTASHINSTVIGGKGNTASAARSTAAGSGVNAQAHSEFAIGTYSQNATSPDANSIVATDRLVTIGNGTSNAARSNALVILKNGNTDINGELKANSLGVDGQFTLPTSDGTNGQVLTTNGSGAVAWSTPSTSPSVTTISANTTLTNSDEIVFINGAFTATFPASPTDGMKLTIGTTNTSAIVNGNGKNLYVAHTSGASFTFLTLDQSMITFYYSSTLDAWLGNL